MITSYVFRQASDNDIDRIWQIILQAKAQMVREGKTQWTESYPSCHDILDDIHKRYARVLTSNDTIIAYGAVTFDGEPAYRNIKGQWIGNEPYATVHRLAVADEVKRQGVAAIFMSEVAGLCRDNNITGIRVDTNYDNYYMLKLLRHLDFTYCGEVVYDRGGCRLAYEKLL